ncbi:MAG: hypothetical protein COV76_03905, partial [Candidatus Omnitrophica bacterium CG11_big_fil_rev_8_21_14_0_20_64_10]
MRRRGRVGWGPIICLTGLLTAGPLVCLPDRAWARTDSEAPPVVDERIEEIYLSVEEALRIAFPEAETIEHRPTALTPAQRKRVEAHAGRAADEPVLQVYVGRRAGQVTGYAVITEEIGMYKPITAIVVVTPEGVVREAAVMVYRESRG